MRIINLPSHSATTMLMLVAMLLAGNTPSRATAQSASRSQLQALVTDTAYQIELSYRFNETELEKRRDEVGRAIEAWNKSARGENENRQLADWLRGAIRASMPGSREVLPPLPEFVSQRKTESPPTSVASERAKVNEPTAGSSTTAPPVIPGDSNPIATDATATETSTATEHTLMRPTSAVSEIESSASSQTPRPSSPPTSHTEQSPNNSEDITADSFWEEHPASEPLPAELMNGDPFRDDPLPSGDDLFDE